MECIAPATARPRGQPASAAELEPPTDDEKTAIERSLVELPKFSGGEVGEEAELGLTVSILRGRGPGYNFAGGARWATKAPRTGRRRARSKASSARSNQRLV